MDYRARNLPSKRTFGKDITNLDRRGKNASICEKPGMVPELRNNKSRSFASRTSSESKEALLDYETDIVNFMLNMQRKEKRELLVHTNE